MHSGYPICCSNVSTTNAFDLEHMTTVEGPWGLLHAIGHNFNNKDYTVSATTEVTNNWWSFYLWGVSATDQIVITTLSRTSFSVGAWSGLQV